MDVDKVAEAIFHALESPNEADRNGEQANVVDGLFEVARAIRALARVQAAVGGFDSEAYDHVIRGSYSSK